MLFTRTLILTIGVSIGISMSSGYSGDIISCGGFEKCPEGSVKLASALTPSSVESVQEIDPPTTSLDADPVEPLIFKDGFEGELSGPLVATVTIGPQGGDFDLTNGISLSIPPDAVPEETTFRFRVIQETELVLPTNIFKTHDIGYLGGFEATPYGYMFSQPISISIPSADLPDSTSLPFPMFVNTLTNEFTPINDLDTIAPGINSLHKSAITPSENIPAPPGYLFWTKKIKITCGGQLVMPDLSALPLDQASLALLAVERLLQESDCVKDPCRCCGHHTLSEDFDSASSSNDGCYSVYSVGSVTFLNCPGQPTESWNLEESNLNVTVNPESASIEIKEITKFTVSLTDKNDDTVTGFSITNVTVKDASVITTRGYDENSVWFEGLSAGTSDVELTITAGGCYYKARLTVQVVDEVIFVTDINIVIVTEGCGNTFKVKLESEPPFPVSATVSSTGGDPDIQIESGSAFSFDESNWSTYKPVTLNAEWDADDENGSTQFEISGSTPDNEDVDVVSKIITAEEYDISKISLAIEGSASKYNEGPVVELHDYLSGTVSLDIEQGTASGHAILDYSGNGYGIIENERCDYTIVGTGVIDVEGFTTCIENECTLSLGFELYTDYIFYNSCNEPVHNRDEYEESEIINLSPQNDYIYDESAEYDVGEAHYTERMRIEWLLPPNQ